ncbi:hypothetical protein K7432_001935 [Basidiobolus ranarum]|uniref:Uncharacterized protein n=1 Tax=Basidiobolus ranarum TaxID=34480 RepID=A0ABR2X2H8_9FUNG
MTTYVITGASRGLGLEFVTQILNNEEAKVYACCRNPSSAKELNQLKSTFEDRLSIHKLDVNDEESIKAGAEEISTVASNGIDVLINNAGVGSDAPGLTKTSKAVLESMFSTNVSGPMLVAQQFIPLLEKGNQKKIINIGSILGSIALNISMLPQMGYAVTKTALNMLTTCFAKELSDKGFVVISIHPGWVQTDLGGEDAPVTPKQSISGMMKVINGLTATDNGKFLTFEGETLPW